MLAFNPWAFMINSAMTMPSGKLMTATKDDRKWNKKAKHTSATMISSSTKVSDKLAMARSIKSERS